MSFVQFISSGWGIVTTIATAAATIWGLAKAIGAFKIWCKKQFQQRKEIKEFPQKVFQLFEQVKVDIGEMHEKLQIVSNRMNDNDEATATLMLEKLMSAYYKFVLEKQEIPLDTKTAMVVMYDQYKKNPQHNHVPVDFIERINECKVVGSK